jgi:hypothetical protein
MLRRVPVIPCVAACGLALALPLSGCGPKKHPTHTSSTMSTASKGAGGATNPQSPSMNDADMRVSELRQRSQELTQATQQLPGRGAADDRKKVADAFAKASDSLELLGGPNPGGAFRQSLRIIDNTRQFLESSNHTVAPDPSVDTGLRSIEGALASVREQLFPNDDKIKQQLDLYRTRLSELDSVRGPIHSLVVAQAFGAASSVIDSMSMQLEARNDAVRQAQQPAAQPSAPAAAAPRSNPPAIPAAATTSPPPVVRNTPPAPAPAAAGAAAGAAAPSAASIPPPPAQKRSYEELQRDYEKLQQQYQELQQKMQQQPPSAPAPAPAH